SLAYAHYMRMFLLAATSISMVSRRRGLLHRCLDLIEFIGNEGRIEVQDAVEQLRRVEVLLRAGRVNETRGLEAVLLEEGQTDAPAVLGDVLLAIAAARAAGRGAV